MTNVNRVRDWVLIVEYPASIPTITNEDFNEVKSPVIVVVDQIITLICASSGKPKPEVRHIIYRVFH